MFDENIKPPGWLSRTAVAIAKGSIAAASTLTLVKGTMKMMTWMKIKNAFVAGAIVLFAGGAAMVAFSQTSNDDKTTAQEIVQISQDAYAALSSYRDTGTTTTEALGHTMTCVFNIRLERPNYYRIEWTNSMAGVSDSSKGIAWSSGNENLMQLDSLGLKQKAPIKNKYKNLETALAAETGVSMQASETVPGTFFSWGKDLDTSIRTFEKLEDENVGDVDCYVVSGRLDISKLPDLPNKASAGKTTTTFWIGKRDYLIRKKQTVSEGASINYPQLNDSQIKKMLESESKPVTPENIAAMKAKMQQTQQAMKKTQSLIKNENIVIAETHENISVNQKISPSDFENAR